MTQLAIFKNKTSKYRNKYKTVSNKLLKTS